MEAEHADIGITRTGIVDNALEVKRFDIAQSTDIGGICAVRPCVVDDAREAELDVRIKVFDHAIAVGCMTVA